MFVDCTEPGCDEDAIGTGRWKKSPREPQSEENPYPPDPARCRPHHHEAIAERIETWQVIGPLEIVDFITGESVMAPGLVRLDPAETRLKILKRLKFIAPVEPLAAEPAAKADTKPAAKASTKTV
jgi:hypothetical protein